MERIYQTTPTGRDAHHDMPLSNLAVMAFNTQDDEFVADRLFPEVPVGKQSNRYYIIDKGAFLRIPDTRRAPKTRAGRVEFEVSSSAYFADNYALAGELSIEDINNADNPIQLRQNETLLVTNNLKRDQENRIASLVTSISNVGSGVQLTGTNKWSDANSDPVADVTTGHAFMRSQTGLVANTAVIDWDTLQILRRHPLLLDMYKYTNGGEVTDGQIQSVFKVDQMLIGRGIKENSREGGTSSMTNIWGNNVVLAHVGPSTGMRSRTFGLRFNWRPPTFRANMAVTRAVENQAGSQHVEIIEAGYYQDEVIVASQLAYCIADTL
jgi:hypothetical protein